MTPNSLAPITFALLVALTGYAQAQPGDSPPPPDRNPVRVQETEADKAETLPGDAPTVPWTNEEVAAAKLDCAEALAGLELEYETLPPIKEGMCGAPAPIFLKSIGSNPKVAIDPPATVTCAVARGLSAWLNNTVQPNAKALLDTQVVKLHNAASYSCRNRYGGENTPLSEHALANALDVSEFVFESGEKVTVLESWPRIATVPPMPLPNPARAVAGNTGSITSAQAAPPKAVESFEVTKANVSAKTNPFVVGSSVAKAPPLAAPAEAVAPETQSQSGLSGEFVKTVHDQACAIFGTVLGPAANEAHKDHFHLDMKARKRRAFCE